MPMLGVPLAASPLRQSQWLLVRLARGGYGSSSSNALAACKSAVSKPSVNQL
jgi:hypothetical protein